MRGSVRFNITLAPVTYTAGVNVVARRVVVAAICLVGAGVLLLRTTSSTTPLVDAAAPSTADVPAPQQPSSSAAPSVPASSRSASPTASTSQAPTLSSPAVSSPAPHDDRTPPTPVHGLHLARNSRTHFTVAWQPSQDSAGIANYQVLLNGGLVARPTDTSVSLAWPSDVAQLLVQVSAVDGNGNTGEWRAIYVLAPVSPSTGRPNPSSSPTRWPGTPTVAPTSSAPTSPIGTASPTSTRPSASATPSCDPSADVTNTYTAQPDPGTPTPPTAPPTAPATARPTSAPTSTTTC